MVLVLDASKNDTTPLSAVALVVPIEAKFALTGRLIIRPFVLLNDVSEPNKILTYTSVNCPCCAYRPVTPALPIPRLVNVGVQLT